MSPGLARPFPAASGHDTLLLIYQLPIGPHNTRGHTRASSYLGLAFSSSTFLTRLAEFRQVPFPLSEERGENFDIFDENLLQLPLGISPIERNLRTLWPQLDEIAAVVTPILGCPPLPGVWHDWEPTPGPCHRQTPASRFDSATFHVVHPAVSPQPCQT